VTKAFESGRVSPWKQRMELKKIACGIGPLIEPAGTGKP